jgi:hypothetical protein
LDKWAQSIFLAFLGEGTAIRDMMFQRDAIFPVTCVTDGIGIR